MAKQSKKLTPTFDWLTPQHDWEFTIRVPVIEGKFDGECVEARGRIESAVTERAVEANEFVASAHDIGGRVSWCSDFEQLVCRFDADGKTLLAVRRATEVDLSRLRVPTFIQEDEWPVCCGRSMQFVGQIDDDRIATEEPPDAEVWWHDAASFYVFTCCVCLACRATGQQF